MKNSHCEILTGRTDLEAWSAQLQPGAQKEQLIFVFYDCDPMASDFNISLAIVTLNMRSLGDGTLTAKAAKEAGKEKQS